MSDALKIKLVASEKIIVTVLDITLERDPFSRYINLNSRFLTVDKVDAMIAALTHMKIAMQAKIAQEEAHNGG